MTEPQQPPAGWYPDPQDAQQQRYWDGSTWTGHTAPSTATVAAPTGASPYGASLPTGAPAWAMSAGGPVTGKRSWYKRPLIIVPVAIVAILVVLVVIGAIVGSNSDHSSDLAKSIKQSGQQQLQANLSQLSPGATATIDDAHCVETGSTQQYTCLVHYTVSDPSSGESQRYSLDVSGTCNNTNDCQWPATGAGTPVAN